MKKDNIRQPEEFDLKLFSPRVAIRRAMHLLALATKRKRVILHPESGGTATFDLPSELHSARTGHGILMLQALREPQREKPTLE